MLSRSWDSANRINELRAWQWAMNSDPTEVEPMKASGPWSKTQLLLPILPRRFAALDAMKGRYPSAFASPWWRYSAA
jgi:hypothetical protein